MAQLLSVSCPPVATTDAHPAAPARTRPWATSRAVCTWAGIAASAAVMRFAGLAQYPAAHPDEGFWSIGARNFVHYGDALMDGRLHPFLSPANFALLTGWFSVFPADLVSARALSSVLGLLTVAVLGFVAATAFQTRGWLPPLLLAFSSLAVLISRTGLLEAHQTFWLMLAAAVWLSGASVSPGDPRSPAGPRRTAIAAALCFAAALLVKANSLYLLPAFILTPPHDGTGRATWRPVHVFLATCSAVAGGVYLSIWVAWPVELATAFLYELDGAHFDAGGAVFHVGRFGIRPGAALTAFRQLLTTDAPLVGLAIVGSAFVVRRLFSADPARSAGRKPSLPRENRFFLLWVACGLLFLFGQIYVEHRYLTTLAPAFAFLAARAIAALWERSRRWRLAGAVVLAVFCSAHAGRAALGVARNGNADYWRVVEWMRREGPPDARVLAAPIINLSLPQRGYDFYRTTVSYTGGRRPLADAVARLGISFVIIDPEWRQYETAAMALFVNQHGRALLRAGNVTVIALPVVDMAGAGARRNE